ncbi:MAG TPA: ABC transporter ATP-binding protein [Candidatus Paenibacillus intestinavium]|nr:ABC transporter ATP-binding protein [Candidatus Paenibacillus intestinavium]
MYYLTHTLTCERRYIVNQVENNKDNIILTVDQLTKKIGQQTLVDQLSFQARKGEIVGLLGPNGAGKTTTIRMIVGLIKMTSGDVFIQGKSIRSQFTEAIRHVGAIVENPEFYSYMTGLDNLKQYQRMSEGVTEERMQQVVKLVGLTEAMNKKVKAYSLGMRQRLGIAQALLHNPSILILDEPTNGLDPAGIREMRDYLKQIAAVEGIAILVSSHLLSEMELMCSRVVVIQQGKYVTEQLLADSASPISNNEGVTLMFIVDNAQLAASVMQTLAVVQIVNVNVEAQSIILQTKNEAVPSIVRAFSEQGVGLYRIIEEKQTLEDEFLKWTGGGQIV